VPSRALDNLATSFWARAAGRRTLLSTLTLVLVRSNPGAGSGLLPKGNGRRNCCSEESEAVPHPDVPWEVRV
jgi:hypothetical protein